VALLSLIYSVSFVDRFILSLVAEPVRLPFNLDDGTGP
jgi:hypothetical protein